MVASRIPLLLSRRRREFRLWLWSEAQRSERAPFCRRMMMGFPHIHISVIEKRPVRTSKSVVNRKSYEMELD
jgi:hypothetical protein